MIRRVFLQQGVRYFGGVSLPWYVPRSIVTGGLTDAGFQNIEWHDRSEPVPVSPQSDPSYRDDWTEWVAAVFRGQDGSTADVPEQVSWVVTAVPLPAPQPQAAAPSAQSSTSAYLQGIVRAALQSGNPAVIRQTAIHLRDAGLPALADQLEWYAGRIGETKGSRAGPWIAVAGVLLTAVGIFVGTLASKGRRR